MRQVGVGSAHRMAPFWSLVGRMFQAMLMQHVCSCVRLLISCDCQRLPAWQSCWRLGLELYAADSRLYAVQVAAQA